MTSLEDSRIAALAQELVEAVRQDAGCAMAVPAADALISTMITCVRRRATYGASEERFADLALAVFPDGLTLVTRADWVRYGIFHQLLSKLARYNFTSPHQDSIHDIQGYGAMMEAADAKYPGGGTT